MAAKSIGVGIIGTGFGKAVHLPAFRSLEKVRVIGMASRDPQKSCQIAEEFSLPNYFADWRELVDCPEVQAVAVVGPNSLHEEMALRALSLSKAVLCEKPLALNLAQARNLCERARKSGQVHMVNFLFREHPVFQKAREIIRMETLGRSLYATVEFTTSSGPPNLSWTWRSDREEGGIQRVLGVHALDYISWMLGPIRSLAAFAGTRVPFRSDEASSAMKQVTSEDCVQAVLEVANGTPVSLVVSSLASAGRRHRIEVVAEKGTLRIINEDDHDHNRFELWVARPRQGFEQIRLVEDIGSDGDGRIAMFRRLADRFITAIEKNQRDVEPSFFDGYRAQLLMDLIEMSHRERRWVKVEEVIS